MASIAHLLTQKGHDVWSARTDDTVLSAIQKMAEVDVGALVVVENGKVVGIITERHYARNVFLKGLSSPDTLVGDIMERNVVCVSGAETVENCMAVMTDRRIRHLPVVDGENLIGIISIGDLVKSIISDREFVITELVQYIHGHAA
jgi:CBS domain-containing protein